MEMHRGQYWVLVFVIIGSAQAQLIADFYGSRCSNVEEIVRQTVTAKMNETFVTVPATLRLFFHDCFVEGCDASVMISSSNGDAEKDAPDNLSLAGDGFDMVIRAKRAVEAQCPGVVSCADILAIAARDVVSMSGGPSYTVELGRLDGLISQASRVTGNLPEPTNDLDHLNTMFRKNNLTQTDMIALSGAHTVGFSHCNRFADRIYNFNSSTGVDPTMDPIYAEQLKLACPRNVDPSVAIDMDPNTPRAFDNRYYTNLEEGKGLFTSDQLLFEDLASRSTVNDFVTSATDFEEAFAVAMIKLGRVGVKTGEEGEIRRDCSAFNSP